MNVVFADVPGNIRGLVHHYQHVFATLAERRGGRKHCQERDPECLSHGITYRVYRELNSGRSRPILLLQ